MCEPDNRETLVDMCLFGDKIRIPKLRWAPVFPPKLYARFSFQKACVNYQSSNFTYIGVNARSHFSMSRVLILYFVRPLVILRTNFITTFKLILYKNRTIQQSRVATSHTERVEYKV